VLLTHADSIEAQKKHMLHQHCMTTPFEAIFLDDRKVKHDNKPILPQDDAQDCYRDVLVMWARQPQDEDKEYFNAHPKHKVELTEFPEDSSLDDLEPRLLTPTAEEQSGRLCMCVRILKRGFFAFDGPAFQELLKGYGATEEDLRDYPNFWDHLGDDEVYVFRKTTQTRVLYDNEKGVLRLQRAPFKVPYGENEVLKDQERNFPEAGPEFVNSTVTHAIWRLMRQIAKAKGQKDAQYICGFHQFRIIKKAQAAVNARPDGALEDCPTPEGVHQDGAEIVLITFIGSKNMAPRSGESRIYDLKQPSGVLLTRSNSIEAQKKHRLQEHCMTTPFEAIILDDRNVKHDNKPILPRVDSQDCYRDVLVMWVRQPNEEDTKYFDAHPEHKVELTEFPEDAWLDEMASHC